MARDLTRLSAGDKKSYEQQASLFGEAFADTWYDKHTATMGLAGPPAAGAPATDTQILEATLRPSVAQMQARMGVGEFAPRPEMREIFIEEQKALEAQKQRFVDLGEKTDAEVRLQIATDLSSQGLSPIGPTSGEYKRRFEEEYGAAQTAEKKAAEAVIPARSALTPGFSPKPPIVAPTTIAKQPTLVEQMTGGEAILSALRPQVLETPDETTQRKNRELNERMFNNSAAKLASQTGITVEQAKRNILDETRQQFRMDAVRILGPGYTNEDYDAMAADDYDKWLKANLPSEYGADLQLREGGAGLAAKIAGETASRSLEFLIGVAATDKYDPQIYKEAKQKLGITPATEAVVESLPMTAVRDLAGLSRFVFNPLLDLAFYDVQPGTDEKINPEEYGFLPRERSGAKEEGAWGKSYIAARTPGSVDDSLREIAVEIATARSLGDDLAAQQAVRPEDEDKLRGVGVLAEVALPINLLSVPGTVMKTTAGAAGRAAKLLPEAISLSDSTIDMFKTLQKSGELLEALPGNVAGTAVGIPSSIYNALVRNTDLVAPIVNAAKKFDITLGDELMKSTKLVDKIIDSNKVSSVVAINTATQFNALRWIASGVDLNSPLAARIEKDAPQIWKAVTDPAAIVNPQKMATKILEDISKSKAAPSSNTAKSALIPVSQRALNDADAYMLSRQQLRNSLVEDLSDTSLGGWTFVTPNVVMTTTAAKKIMPELVTKTKSLHSEYVVYDPMKKGMVLKKDIDVKDLLDRSVVQNSNARMRHYEDLLFLTTPGKVLTPDEYKALNDLLAETVVYEVSRAQKLGAFAPARAGRAVQSAAEPIQLRSDLIQFTSQVSDNVARWTKNLRKNSFISAPPAKYVDAVANEYAGFLEGFPAQFTNTVRRLSKEGFRENEIYSVLLARTYGKVGPLLQTPTGALIKPGATFQAPAIIANDSIQAIKDVMKVQFDLDYSTARGQAISKIIEGLRPGLINPFANATLLYNKIVDVRQKILNAFPELANQEVVSSVKRGSRTFERSSLPETILAVTFENSKKIAFSQILNANRSKIYDDIAVRSVRRLTSGAVSDEIMIKALNDGLYARLDNPGSVDIVDVIRQSLKASGISDSDVNLLLNSAGRDIVDAVNAYAIDAYRRSPGWMVVDGAQTLRRLDMQISSIADSELIALLPSNMQSDIAFIQQKLAEAKKNPITGNQIASIMDTLERQSPGLTGRVLGDMAHLFGMSYSSLVEGMLAGRLLPNISYLSDNVVGAPLIAAVTNPEYIDFVMKNVPAMASKSFFQALPGAPSRLPSAIKIKSYVGDFRNYGGYTQKYYDAAVRAPSAIAITTPAGEAISNEALWNLITQARLGRAQAAAVVDPRVINQIRDLTEILGDPEIPKQWLKETTKQLLDAAPSGRISVPVTVATNTDMAFRTELFVEALRRGATPVEASAIARETLLDYDKLNRVLPGKLGALKKPFLFISFSASMSLAILKGATRGEPIENMLRLARAHRSLAKNSGVFAPDGPMLESLALDQQVMIDDKPVTWTYARDPVMGQIFWMSGLVDGMKNILLSEKKGEAALETFEQLCYVPWLDFMLDIATAKAGIVNARQVARWKQLGMWELVQEQFGIEEVPLEKMRGDEPSFDGRQYRFKTPAGKQGFIAYEQAIAMMGWNRTVSDYYNAMVAQGMAPKGTFLARYSRDNPEFEGIVPPEGGFVDGLLYALPYTSAPQYMLLRQRAVRPPTQIELYDRQIQTEMRKLKELQFEQVDTE